MPFEPESTPGSRPPSVAVSPFEDTPDLYDALFDWKRRLAAEESLYRRVFERAGAKRVLDAACGTGQHAMLFRSWGLEVEGADLSESMIEFCRREHGESERQRWTVRSFCDPVLPPASFDAAICVGNSLALAPDRRAARDGIRALLEAVRPGGVVLVHVINLWRLPDGPTQWQKSLRLTLDGADRVLLKGLRRVGERGFVELVRLELGADGGLDSRFHNPCFLGLEVHELREASDGLAEDVEILGSFRSGAYVSEESPDLIAVFTRS